MQIFLHQIIQRDIDLFLFFNQYHNHFFDIVMSFISGKYSWIPLYAFILFLILRKFKLKKGLLILLSIIMLIVLTDQTSVFLFKFTFLRFRPCYDPNIASLVHTVKLPGGRYGFISSHAANAFAFAFFTTLIFKNKLFTILIFLWAITVAYSRIYLGVHYPSDVFVGAVWGMFSAYLIFILLKNKILREQ